MGNRITSHEIGRVIGISIVALIGIPSLTMMLVDPSPDAAGTRAMLLAFACVVIIYPLIGWAICRIKGGR